MQHEILLALVGCPGNTFSVSRESGLFEVIPDLPFIHPSEVALLNRLSALGTYYMQLRDFIRQQTSLSTALGSCNHGESSLYHKAMAYGMDEVLDTYRQKLVDVEQKCVVQPDLPVSHIQHEFEDYQFLLPALDSCVKYVHTHKLYGCQILSYIHQQCSCGITSVRTAFERILYTCHHVLYKQLSAWMLHGSLLDQKGEFFIEKIDHVQHEEEGEDECDEEAATLHSDSAAGKDISQFQINDTLAPSYLPPRVLEKILFIGEAVQIFQTLDTSSAHPPLPSYSDSSGFHLRKDLVKFGKMLIALQNNPVFQLRDFENTIEHIRNVVAEHLWKLVVQESKLVDHLQVMKDMYLLGRGELYLSFVDVADALLKQPPTTTTQHDMNIAFTQAMIKVAMDHEELTKQFQLTLSPISVDPEKAPARLKKKSSSWKDIGMAHSVSWPLHVVFTPSALEKYSTIFHFLLCLRRAQIHLQQCWATLMTIRTHTRQLQPIWQLRTHMGFLIDNLQYYVQVDVLETQYSLLLNKIKSTHDFEAVKSAHNDFINTLQAHLFFSLEPIRRCVNEILELCFSFSELILRLNTDNFVVSSERQDTLDHISMDFRRQSSLLFRVLSTVRNHHSAPHIAQLLLRIDYNRYFTTST